MSTSNDPSVKRRPRWRRVLVISGQLLVGLGLGAAIAEYAFDRRDDGAFPHVNFYLPDPELGVRLEPGASMRFQLRQNPVSTIHVNPLGYRGADWPAPAPPTSSSSATPRSSASASTTTRPSPPASPQLRPRRPQRRRAHLRPARVPRHRQASCSPPARSPASSSSSTSSTTPSSSSAPTPSATPCGTAGPCAARPPPPASLDFPGRRWLFSRSHAVYALRRWLHERGSAAPPRPSTRRPIDFGTPSEGGLHDLVLASQSAHGRRSAQAKATELLAQASSAPRPSA
jgi:hypothetical protein